MLKTLEYLVFDLDGTLYQNTEFYKDYIHFLLDGTPKAKWESALISLAADIFEGKVLPMNTFIQIRRCEASSFSEYVAQLRRLEQKDLEYAEALQKRDMCYMGDAWAVANFLGETLGLLENGRTEQVYRRTRQKMEKDGMKGDPRLRRMLIELSKRFTVILASNSYEETAKDFLQQLGFDEVFLHAIYSANKPFDLHKNLVREFPAVLSRPSALVSIGDHAFNDLMPIAAAGGRTVFINPYPLVKKPHCDVELRGLNDLSDYLEGLIL